MALCCSFSWEWLFCRAGCGRCAMRERDAFLSLESDDALSEKQMSSEHRGVSESGSSEQSAESCRHHHCCLVRVAGVF